MKKIIINNNEYYYQYEVDQKHNKFTAFYITEEYAEKQFIFFGKLIKRYKFIYCFSIFIDIEDYKHTKELMKKIIEKAESNYIYNKKRSDEINVVLNEQYKKRIIEIKNNEII